MFKHVSLIAMATATICLSAAVMPTFALDLSTPVGTVTGAVTSTVQGTVGNSVAGTTASLRLLSNNEAVAANARSNLLGGLSAKLKVLSDDELLKLCIKVGAGSNSCGAGNRSQMISLITARVDVLKPNQLAGVCLSVGGSCGGSGGGAGGGGGGGSQTPSLGNVSSHDLIAYKKTCNMILGAPSDYDHQLVRMCRRVILANR